MDENVLCASIEKMVESAARESDDEETFYALLTGYVAKLNADIDYKMYSKEAEESPDHAPDGPVYNLFWTLEPTVVLFRAIQKFHRCSWDAFIRRLPPIIDATVGGCFKTKTNNQIT